MKLSEAVKLQDKAIHQAAEIISAKVSIGADKSVIKGDMKTISYLTSYYDEAKHLSCLYDAEEKEIENIQDDRFDLEAAEIYVEVVRTVLKERELLSVLIDKKPAEE